VFKRLRLPSLRDLADEALIAFRRFPLPAAAACGATVFGLAKEHKIELLQGAILNSQMLQFLILGFFATLLAKFVAERRGADENGFGGLLGLALALTLLALTAFVVSGSWTVGYDIFPDPAMAFLFAGFVLLIMATPFRAGEPGNAALWDFNRIALTGIIFGFTVAVILGAGLNAVLLAMDKLFGIDVPRKLNSDIWIVCFCLIWPWRALSSMPSGFAVPEGDYCPRWIGFIARYIYVPLACVYLVILYAFAVKIGVQWDLPKGQIAWLVCWFALVGVATKLTIYPLRDVGHRLLRLFDRGFFPALFLPAGLLAIAVGVRVQAYGLTEERYLLILLTVWLLAIAVFFTFGGRRLVVAPLLLGVLLMLASVGPWGAVDVSIRNQIARLEPLLIENGFLADGRLARHDRPIPFETNKQIGALVVYLTAKHRRPHFIAWLDGRQSGLELSGIWGARSFVQALGMPYVSQWQETQRFSLRVAEPLALPVSGYDVMIRQAFYRKTGEKTVSGPASSPVYRIGFSGGTGIVTVRDAFDQAVRFDLGQLAEQLNVFSRVSTGRTPYSEEFALDGMNGSLRIRFVVLSMNGARHDDRIRIDNFDGVFLFKTR
jgi:uncharacterized protein DUF4153